MATQVCRFPNRPHSCNAACKMPSPHLSRLYHLQYTISTPSEFLHLTHGHSKGHISMQEEELKKQPRHDLGNFSSIRIAKTPPHSLGFLSSNLETVHIIALSQTAFHQNRIPSTRSPHLGAIKSDSNGLENIPVVGMGRIRPSGPILKATLVPSRFSLW